MASTTVSARSATSVSDWPTPTVSTSTTSTQRAQQHGGGGAGVGQAAQSVARRHRAHEHAGVVRVDLDPGAVAQQRAAGPARGRVDGDDPDRPVPRAPRAHERGSQGRLADAWRAGQPDDVAARLDPGGIEQVEGRLGVRGASSSRASARASAALPPARSVASGSPSLKRQPSPASAAWAAASRAIGTR